LDPTYALLDYPYILLAAPSSDTKGIYIHMYIHIFIHIYRYIYIHIYIYKYIIYQYLLLAAPSSDTEGRMSFPLLSRERFLPGFFVDLSQLVGVGMGSAVK
jgi:hypothetical protein